MEQVEVDSPLTTQNHGDVWAWAATSGYGLVPGPDATVGVYMILVINEVSLSTWSLGH